SQDRCAAGKDAPGCFRPEKTIAWSPSLLLAKNASTRVLSRSGTAPVGVEGWLGTAGCDPGEGAKNSIAWRRTALSGTSTPDDSWKDPPAPEPPPGDPPSIVKSHSSCP